MWADDFLNLSAGAVPIVDGVIANPPFTRNHAIERQRRKAVRQRFDIDGAAMQGIIGEPNVREQRCAQCKASRRLTTPSGTLIEWLEGITTNGHRTDKASDLMSCLKQRTPN